METSQTLIHLKDVRLAFPSLFEPKASVPGGKEKYRATFLLPANHPAKAQIERLMVKAAQLQWKERADQMLNYLQTQRKIYCLSDGNAQVNKETGKPWDGFAGHWCVSASNKLHPAIFGRQREQIGKEEAHKLYGGCWVNAHLDIRALDYQGIQSIYAELLGVQFVRDDTPFSRPRVASIDDFEDMGPAVNDQQEAPAPAGQWSAY